VGVPGGDATGRLFLCRREPGDVGPGGSRLGAIQANQRSSSRERPGNDDSIAVEQEERELWSLSCACHGTPALRLWTDDVPYKMPRSLARCAASMRLWTWSFA
jgi:hypothetical protein